MGIVSFLTSCERRADAWAAKRLSADEFREASELDRYVKANFWPFSVSYVASTLVLGVLLIGVKPAMSFSEALILANILLASLGVALTGVWFGYRRHQGKPLWRTALAITALAAAGAVCGALVAKVTSGKGLQGIGLEEMVRFVSIGILAGLIVAAFVVGATWIRMREARAREATLKAEAERERFAKRTAEAELKLLQAQVEAHFLFNTLANLRYLVQTGSRDALPMLDHLIDYLRTALPEMRAESSTVAREAPLARAYLEIIRIRMGGELEFRGAGLAAGAVVVWGLAQAFGLQLFPSLTAGDQRSASFGNVNMTAQFLGVAVLLLLAHDDEEGGGRGFRRTVVVGAFAYVYFLACRSVVLGLVAGLAVQVSARRLSSSSLARMLGAALLIVLAVLRYGPPDVPHPMRARVLADKGWSTEMRLEVWRGTASLMRDHPLGVGAGSFGDAFIPYQLGLRSIPGEALLFRTPHNAYLRAPAEDGLVFGAFFPPTASA